MDSMRWRGCRNLGHGVLSVIVGRSARQAFVSVHLFCGALDTFVVRLIDFGLRCSRGRAYVLVGVAVCKVMLRLCRMKLPLLWFWDTSRGCVAGDSASHMTVNLRSRLSVSCHIRDSLTLGLDLHPLPAAGISSSCVCSSPGLPACCRPLPHGCRECPPSSQTHGSPAMGRAGKVRIAHCDMLSFVPTTALFNQHMQAQHSVLA